MSRFCCWLVCVALAGGCASNETKKPAKTPPPTDPAMDLPSRVNAAGATYSVYGPPPAHALYYTIHTTDVHVDIGENALQKGIGSKVTGEVFGKAVDKFSADGARAAKSSPEVKDLDVLTLTGNVVVHSLKPAGTLKCDKLIFDMKKQLVMANGNVHFNTADGRAGTLPEAWATQDLSHIASPELFEENLNQ